jgi:hypothetical protein
VCCRKVARNVILASEQLGTACIGARIKFALFVVDLTVTPHILWILEAEIAIWTSMSSFLGRVMDSFVVSTAWLVDVYTQALRYDRNTYLTPDRLAKLLPQEKHT